MQPNNIDQQASALHQPHTSEPPAQPPAAPQRLPTRAAAAPRARKHTSLFVVAGNAVLGSKLGKRASPALRVLLTKVSDLALRWRSSLREGGTRS